MPTRNVVLTDQQADMVEELVHSGRYQNASEVLRNGLRLLERREAEESAKLEALGRSGDDFGEQARVRYRRPRHLIAFYVDDSGDVIVARVFLERQMLSRHLRA